MIQHCKITWWILLFPLLIIYCAPVAKNNSNTFDHNDWSTSRKDFANTASVNDSISLPLTSRFEIDFPVSPLTGIMASAVGTGNHLFIGADSNFYAINATTGAQYWMKHCDGQIKDAALLMARNKDTVGVYLNTSGATIYALTHETGELIWEVNHYFDPLYSQQQTTYLNGGSGIFYVNRVYPGNNSRLNVLSPVDGSIQWTKEFINTPILSPVHGSGAVFCFGNTHLFEDDDYYHSLNRNNGNHLWRFEEPFPEHDPNNNFALSAKYTNGVFYSDVEVSDTAMIIFSTGVKPARVVAATVSIGGEILKHSKWKTLLPDNEWVTGFAITRNQPVKCLIVSTNKGLYRLNPDSGSLLWSIAFTSNNAYEYRTPKPVIWGNYVFHIVDNNSRLVAFDLDDGTELWTYNLDAPTYASPMIGDQTLYIGTGSGKFYAFSPEE